MSSSFRNIVQQVTQEKLKELKNQSILMNNHFNPVLKQIENPSVNPSDALQILHEAVQNTPVKDIIDAVLIENLMYVRKNAKDDPSISSQLVLAWIEKLKQEIKYSLRKCEYSYLYGSLLSEWLENEERNGSKQSASSEEPEELSGLKENVNEDKNVVIKKMKDLMFNQPSPDQFEELTFRKFLSEELLNFDKNSEGQSIMKTIRRESEQYFEIAEHYISSYDVRSCIEGLRSSELLTSEKKAALKELSENSEALIEVSSLLTNRLRNLERWEWPSHCEVLELRRGLAGEYKAFMNEDIITALFLQYVGVQWASYFKKQFLKIYESKIWTRVYSERVSIESTRKEFHRSTFLSSLPDSINSQSNNFEGEYVKMDAVAGPPPPMLKKAVPIFMASNFSQADSRGPPHTPRPPILPPNKTSDIDYKQSFLHTLTTEIRLNQVIRPNKPLFVVQANLESFGPSVIHDAALIALECFGVPEQWLLFFKKFLQPKVCFAENENPQLAVRGVPTSHTLSSLFGETLLFLLDFLVNQKCNGMRIYRILDEFWFWNHTTGDVTKAWETMIAYGKMVGLKIKENRSGSIAIYSNEMLTQLEDSSTVQSVMCGPVPLPQNHIHWGYLELHSNGIFKIDQPSIKKFLDEMRGLLDKSECVLEWINVFNKYMAFFVRNFGKCAIVLGKQHLDQIITSLKTIYSGLFGSDGPVEKLKCRFNKLKDADIVDVWVYWPLERGGLGLINPFIGIMSLREAYVEINDEDHFKNLPWEDNVLWNEIVEEHERKYGKIKNCSDRAGVSVAPKVPTWGEYLGKRETELSHWHRRYVELLQRPGPKEQAVSDRYRHLDAPMPENHLETNYLMWLFTYYETQLVLHFGNVKFINSKLLPMSMIANIQKSKVHY